MAAYFFVDIREINDAARMEEYRANVGAIVQKFGGRYIVVGGPFQVVEGSYQPVFPVMLEFRSMTDARKWYDSDEYRDLKNLRLAVTVSNGFFMAGPS